MFSKKFIDTYLKIIKEDLNSDTVILLYKVCNFSYKINFFDENDVKKSVSSPLSQVELDSLISKLQDSEIYKENESLFPEIYNSLQAKDNKWTPDDIDYQGYKLVLLSKKINDIESQPILKLILSSDDLKEFDSLIEQTITEIRGF